MPSVFKSSVTQNVGTTATTVYTAPGSTTSTVIGLSVANTTVSALSVDATLTKGGTTVYLIKAAPIPTGSSLVLIGSDQKVVLETGNLIQVKSSGASSLDVVVSVLELS